MTPLLKRTAAAILAIMLAAPASAAPGLRLSWDHCSADGRVTNRNFACDVNTGSSTLVVSYESPLARTDRTGVEIVMDVFAADPFLLPVWWLFKNAGACRQASLSTNVVAGQPTLCDGSWATSAAIGVAAYQVGQWGPHTAQLLIAAAVAPNVTFTVGPGTETFAANLVINHAKTVGTGACAGCATPVCIGVSSVNLVSADPADNIRIVAGELNFGPSLMVVTWQDSWPAQFSISGTPPGGLSNIHCAPAPPLPTLTRTWGQLRSLYR